MAMDIESALASARHPDAEPESKFPPYIKEEGEHRLILAEYKVVDPKNKAQFLVANLVVKHSSVYPEGYVLSSAWRPFEPEVWKADKEATRAAEFVMRLFDYDDTSKAGKASMALQKPENPGAGMEIDCFVELVTSPKSKKTFPGIKWKHVPDQTNEGVVANREFVKKHVALFEEGGNPVLAKTSTGVSAVGGLPF